MPTQVGLNPVFWSKTFFQRHLENFLRIQRTCSRYLEGPPRLALYARKKKKKWTIRHLIQKLSTKTRKKNTIIWTSLCNTVISDGLKKSWKCFFSSKCQTPQLWPLAKKILWVKNPYYGYSVYAQGTYLSPDTNYVTIMCTQTKFSAPNQKPATWGTNWISVVYV